jgi:hypothetical protein
LNCLQEWLRSKQDCTESDAVNSYTWRKIECEICKVAFPETLLDKQGREINLLEPAIHEGSENYLILESVEDKTDKTIHVLNFEQKTYFTVGRAQSSDVRIADISVSRLHAMISLCDDGTLAIVDLHSKFGTQK